MTIKITAEQLSMRFKERVLFHIPELAIGPNDAIYLKGDNGVGKTTLLKILAGLLKPSTGKVVAPKDTWLKKWTRRNGRVDVIYLHQSPYLFDGTVYETSFMELNINKTRQKISELKLLVRCAW